MLTMISNACPPAPPDASRTLRHPERHSGAADFAAFRVLGEALPCLCPACERRLKGWEVELDRHRSLPEILPPAFWTRQAARLHWAGSVPAPRWRWAAVPAAGLLLAAALFVLPSRFGRAPDDFEARWAGVQEALERPALGDLEACAILLDEGENTAVEESL